MDTLVPELKDAMVGWTITDVVTHDAYESPLAEFVLQRGSVERRVQVCGGDLGGWIRVVKDATLGGPPIISGPDALETMLDDISTHLGRCDEARVIASDDPRYLAIGFRCEETDTNWLVHIRSLKGHKLGSLFSTPEGRQEAARKLNGDRGYFKFYGSSNLEKTEGDGL